MRRLWLSLVLLLAVFLILSSLAEVQQIAETLRRGNPLWLGLALVLQWVWLGNLALTLRSVYRLLGLESSATQLLHLVIVSNFVNTVAPSAGVGGMAVFISDARRRNLSTARVAIAGVLFLILDYFSFLCVLALGLVVLFRRNNLTGIELGGAAIFLVIALAIAAVLVGGIISPAKSERVLLGAVRGVNNLLEPVLKRSYLSEVHAHEFALEAAAGLSVLRTHWLEYVPPTLLSLLSKALMIGILMLAFLAFGQPFSSGTLVAGFSLGHLFTIISPTPAGIGVVEGAMTIALGTLRVPLGTATVITLAYRGLTFWLPFFYGFVGLRLLQRQARQQPESLS